MRLDTVEELQREHEEHLARGGCFVAGHWDLSEGTICEAELVAPNDSHLMLTARVVWVAGEPTPGVGLAFLDFGTELREQIDAFVEAAAKVDAPAPKARAAAALSGRKRAPLNAHERLRGLTAAQQARVAMGKDVNERMVLERIYGKAVWELLLNNSRLTHPEVARIARMGALPVPQLDTICSNPGWLTSGQVRRALLANRRLTPAMIEKVLRATPKHELKLVSKQTAYPPQVRDVAKRILGPRS